MIGMAMIIQPAVRILFSVIIKAVEAGFLFVYYFIIQFKKSILVFGIADNEMDRMIFIALRLDLCFQITDGKG